MRVQCARYPTGPGLRDAQQPTLTQSDHDTRRSPCETKAESKSRFAENDSRGHLGVDAREEIGKERWVRKKQSGVTSCVPRVDRKVCGISTADGSHFSLSQVSAENGDGAISKSSHARILRYRSGLDFLTQHITAKRLTKSWLASAAAEFFLPRCLSQGRRLRQNRRGKQLAWRRIENTLRQCFSSHRR